MPAAVVAHVEYEVGRVVVFDYEVAYPLGLHLVELKGRKPYVGSRVVEHFQFEIASVVSVDGAELAERRGEFHLFAFIYMAVYLQRLPVVERHGVASVGRRAGEVAEIEIVQTGELHELRVILHAGVVSRDVTRRVSQHRIRGYAVHGGHRAVQILLETRVGQPYLYPVAYAAYVDVPIFGHGQGRFGPIRHVRVM